MRDYIEEILDGELPKLEEAKNACNVYTVAIESDEEELINLELVKVDDYNDIVDLYNSLIHDLIERGYTNSYSHTLKRMNKRFFKI